MVWSYRRLRRYHIGCASDILRQAEEGRLDPAEAKERVDYHLRIASEAGGSIETDSLATWVHAVVAVAGLVLYALGWP